MTSSNFHFHVCGCTDTGLVREVNEDHVLVGRFIKNSGSMNLQFSQDDDFLASYGMLFAVSDGVGGAPAGEIASRLTLTTLERHFYGFEKSTDNSDAFRDAVMSAARRANETVIRYAEAEAGCRGMGCTLTGVCLTPSGYWVFNSGDSRVYRFRGGILRQLTDDDTRVNELRKIGVLTSEEAEKSEFKHQITNYVGYSDFKLTIEQGPELKTGDVLLVCSDGVHDLIPVERMEEIISQNPVTVAAARLVEEARANGGHDNISLILVSCKDSPVFEAEVDNEAQ